MKSALEEQISQHRETHQKQVSHFVIQRKPPYLDFSFMLRLNYNYSKILNVYIDKQFNFKTPDKSNFYVNYKRRQFE